MAAAGLAGPEPAWHALFVPGRVCLLGEHSDWAGGWFRGPTAGTDASGRGAPSASGTAAAGLDAPGRTLVVGTTQGLSVRSRAHPCRLRLRATLPSGDEAAPPADLPADAAALADVAAAGGFWSYAAGVAAVLLEGSYQRQEAALAGPDASRAAAAEGADGDGAAQSSGRGPAAAAAAGQAVLVRGGLEWHNHATTLPLRKGLSSSAAVCVAVARAFSLAYDLQLSVEDEMAIAFLGERRTPSLCGRMDQVGAYGPGRVMAMRFVGDRPPRVSPVAVGGPIFLLLVDLGGSKDTIAILSALQAAYPAPRAGDRAAGDRALHRFLGVENLLRVAAAEAALAAGDAAALGRVLADAQREFDACAAPLCPAELAAPLLHALLDAPALRPHIHGGKAIGAGGDGTAQLVCRSADSREAARAVVVGQLGLSCLELTLGEARDAS